MGQDVILEYESISQPKGNCRDKKENSRNSKREQQEKRFYQLKSSDGEIGELQLDRIPNFHCRSMPSRTRNPNSEQNPNLKRGSVYQSSGEVRRLRTIKEERQKVDLKFDKNDNFLSFDIVDSSPKPSMSQVSNYEPKLKSVDPSQTQTQPNRISRGSTEFLDLSFRDLPDKNFQSDSSRRDSSLLKNETEDYFLEISLDNEFPKFKGFERDPFIALSKSHSLKSGILDNGNLRGSTSSPLKFKRMFDPIIKSKSMKSSPLSQTETETARANGVTRKSLLSDFSKTVQKTEDPPVVRSDNPDQISATHLLPAHLRATLRLDSKNGSPSFEFAVKDPEDTLYAKTWKSDNAFNWVYTFHGSNSNNKRTSSSGTGSNSKEKQGSLCLTPVIGQMHVSCYLCSEVNENGNVTNSTATEFILYDIAQARRSSSSTNSSSNSNFTSEDRITCNSDSSVSDRHSDASTSYPWSKSELHPQLETAAIVIQIPFGKNESLKEIREESGCKSSGKVGNHFVNVVTPVGTHGVPCSKDEAGPASLLDRWRYGGGCDCGGWDMGCPLILFDSNFDDESLVKGSNQPFALFVKGSKEKVPALCILPNGKGQYLVDFHAQLSSLQAFSICVALLHCSNSSSDTGQEMNNHKYSSSLKLLLEEEVRQLIEAVTVEEKKKITNNNNKKVEQNSQAFLLDPPFSPMGRV